MRLRSGAIRRSVAAVALAGLAASLGSGATLAQSPAPTPGAGPTQLTVTTTYPSVAVDPGGTATFPLQVTSPVAERVDLSVTGAPEGFPQTTTDPIGDLKAGDILGFNVGMGLALNEKAAISLGYDHSIVDVTKQNGQTLPGSVRVMLGTLLLGGSYRFNDHTSLNVSLGVGVTRDTPDTTLMVRVPVTF